MSSRLFSPLRLRGLTLSNRIMIAPMCQYSAEEGNATDWHLVHLGSLALSGAGLLMVEATAVQPEGRITPRCLGLWSDANERALERVLAVTRTISRIPLGIQIAHAGRKASSRPPFEGGKAIGTGSDSWQAVAPSAIAFDEGWPAPQELGQSQMEHIIECYAATTRRAARLGFDTVELHCAHGYLLSTFLSPLSNRRQDAYGGALEQRMRFPLEVARAVRESWPDERPMSAKINGSDWTEGGWTPDDAVMFARALNEAGVDLVVASSGGVAARASIPLQPGYQVPFAERIRREAGVASGAVGLITDPQHAQDIIAEGRADIVSLARGMLDDPRWPLHAAAVLGAEASWPRQYERAAPRAWPPGAARSGR